MKGNDEIHRRLTRGRARFKHWGDVDGEILSIEPWVYLRCWHEFYTLSIGTNPLGITSSFVHVWFWSLVFMQGFSVESKTSRISSSSTLTRPWIPVQIMQWSKLDSKKPRDQTREDDKLRGPCQKSAEYYETRSFVQLGEKLTTRAHTQKGEGSRRLGNRHRAKEGADWAEVGLGWSAQAGQPSPLRGPGPPPPLT
jgi:hypothetical protein